jgi:hypothetical protein
MAIKRKGSAELPPSGGSIRSTETTKERDAEAAEVQRESDELRESILNYGLSTEKPPTPAKDPDVITGDIGTPVGGRVNEPPTQKPPEAIVSPLPAESGQIPTTEQFNAELSKFKPRNRQEEEGFAAIRGFAGKWHKLAQELDQKLKDEQRSKKELEGKIIPEDQIARWKDIEQRFETELVEKLPEWGEYDKAVQGIEKNAAEFLKQSGVIPNFDSILEVINKKGGLSDFANSEEPAGTNYPGMTRRQWFKQFIFDKLDERQRIRFEQLLAEADNKKTEKHTKLEEKKANAKATLEERGKRAMEEVKTVWDATVKELNGQYLPDFDMPVTLPVIAATDTPEEKKEKQAIIDVWTRVEKEMNRTIPMQPKDIITLRYKAAAFDPMADRYKDLKKRFDEVSADRDKLSEKLESIKGAKRLSRQTIETPTPPASSQNDLEMTTEQALAKAGFPTTAVSR